jgi:hypothetical protein
MSANFLDTSGFCVGTDPHTFIAIGPLGAPLPIPLVGHVVAWRHSYQSRTWRIAKTVTTCGNPVLQSNWAMILVLHWPIMPAAPHALELVQLAGINLAGSATPQLTAHKVTAQGSPLCTAISGSHGLNLDCGDLPTFSTDVNLNTVMTQPTLGDYIAAILSAALSFLYAYGANWAIGKKIPAEEAVKGLKAAAYVAIVQTLADLVNSKAPDGSWAGDPVAVGISKATAIIQQLIDGE